MPVQRSRRITPLCSLDPDSASKTCHTLAREARRAANELESVLSRFHESGAFGEIWRYATKHRTELPDVSPHAVAQALRQYAGILALIAGKLGQSPRETASQQS